MEKVLVFREKRVGNEASQLALGQNQKALFELLPDVIVHQSLVGGASVQQPVDKSVGHFVIVSVGAVDDKQAVHRRLFEKSLCLANAGNELARSVLRKRYFVTLEILHYSHLNVS